MGDYQDAQREKLHKAELEQVTKLALLYSEMVKFNPAYRLIDDAKNWGISKGIRLSNGKADPHEEHVTLYIDSVGRGWGYSYTLPNYYVRINSTGYSTYSWNKNWTFETKDLAKKAHEKMTAFLEGIENSKIRRQTAETEAKRRAKLAKAAYESEHYYVSSDSRYVSLSVKLDAEKWGSTQDFEFAPDEQKVILHKTAPLSKTAFDKILAIIQGDHREQKERESLETAASNTEQESAQS